MWIAILICSIIVFSLVAYIVLPKLFLKVQYIGLNPYDNVVKEIDEKYTSATVYGLDDIRCIEKYALVQKNGYKEVVCKLKPFIHSISYDIVLFGKNNAVLNILSISETVKGSSYTKAVRIPNKVERIMIVINKANKNELKNKYKKSYKKEGLFPYALFSTILFFALAIAIQFSFINIFGDVFYQDIIASNIYLIIAAIGCVLYGVITYFILKLRKFK